MNKEELIEVLRKFDEKRVEELPEKTRSIFYAIMKIADERDRLNKEYERIYNENCKLREEHNITDIKLLDENNRLNNIIDELEKWCNECIDNHIIARENGVTTISDTFFEIVLDKIKALKEE